jgi:hypothetical protein
MGHNGSHGFHEHDTWSAMPKSWLQSHERIHEYLEPNTGTQSFKSMRGYVDTLSQTQAPGGTGGAGRGGKDGDGEGGTGGVGKGQEGREGARNKFHLMACMFTRFLSSCCSLEKLNLNIFTFAHYIASWQHPNKYLSNPFQAIKVHIISITRPTKKERKEKRKKKTRYHTYMPRHETA